MINFVKSKLTQKKTVKSDFNNDFLNKEIPKIFSDLNQNSDRHYNNNKEELEIVGKVKDLIPNYKKNFQQIENIRFSKLDVKT